MRSAPVLLIGAAAMVTAVFLAIRWDPTATSSATSLSGTGVPPEHDRLTRSEELVDVALLIEDVTRTEELQSTGRSSVSLPSRAERKDPAAEVQILEGRVVIPVGTPGSEVIKIVTTPLLPKGRAFLTPVGPDGSFRIRLDDDALVVRVDLAADHLYLEDSVRVRLDGLDGPLLLEPRLGGRILGRVVLPPAGERWRQELVGAPVGLATPTANDGSEISDRARLDDDLRFDMKTVPANVDLRISVRVLPFQDAEIGGDPGSILRVLPGQDLVLVVPLVLAASVVGQLVHAPSGQAEEDWRGAEVFVEQLPPDVEDDSQEGFLDWMPRSDRLGRDGSFQVGPLHAGPAILRVVAPGHIPVEFPLEPLADGEKRDLGRIVLVPGAVLRGRVLLDDGSPAFHALVVVDDRSSPPPPGLLEIGSDTGVPVRELVLHTRTKADGAFKIKGLGAGPCTLVAAVYEYDWHSEIRSCRRIDDLFPSAGEVVVNLSRPLRVSGGMRSKGGIAIDSRILMQARPKEPGLQQFRSWASSDDGGAHFGPVEALSLLSEGFEFANLFEGEWLIDVKAKGFQVLSVPIVLTDEDVVLDLELKPLPGEAASDR